MIRDFDRRIILAYQILQDETCQTCGVPVWIGHNEDNTITFQVHDSTCFSCASLETSREKTRSEVQGRESSRFGVTEYVVAAKDAGTDAYGNPLPGDGGPLPSRADAYEFMDARQKELAVVAAAQKQGDLSVVQ